MEDKFEPSSMTAIELVERSKSHVILKTNGSPLAIEDHPWVLLKSRYVAEGSRLTMRRALATAAEVLVGSAVPPDQVPWWWLRRAHTQELRARLASRFAHTTANKILSFVRQMLDECFDAELLEGNDYHRARRGASPVKGSRELAGRYLERSERELIKTACDDGTDRGIRDRAVITTLEHAALRRSGTAGLNRTSYDGSTLHVVEKGNKERSVPANGPLRAALDAWLVVRGNAPGPLFYAATPDGALVPGRRLSYGGMQAVVIDRVRRANVKNVALHDFRRTLISDLLDEGVDISTVSRIVGHSDVKTTARYDRRPERAAREALERHGNKTAKDEGGSR